MIFLDNYQATFYKKTLGKMSERSFFLNGILLIISIVLSVVISNSCWPSAKVCQRLGECTFAVKDFVKVQVGPDCFRATTVKTN